MAILFVLPSISLIAQTQISENYLITGPWTDYVAPMKYSYIVSDDGERIMNGPISISGQQNETYGPVTITGTYLLNASAKQGNLNGAMSVKANYHGVKTLINGQQVEDYAYSFSGNFLNGIPNGTFTVKATNYGSSTVTYKQGVLVGAYNVKEVISDRILTINGSLNDTGKMVGVWNIESMGDVEVWEFVNGIRIRLSSKHSESTPKQIEMAKKYASGAITSEDLEKEGYYPVRDSIALGDYANDLYFLKFIADWSQMPGYSFQESNWVKYTYLYNLLPLPARVFEEVLTNYKNEGKAPLDVRYDELAKCYITNYWENYGTPKAYVVRDRRFTDSQLKAIDEAVDSYCRQNPISLSKLFNYSNGHDEVRYKVGNIVHNYESIKEETDLIRAYSRCESLIKDIENVSEATKQILEGKDMTPDGLYYIIPGEQLLSAYYFSASTLEEYYAFEQEVKDYSSVIYQRAEEEIKAVEKRAEEERIAKIQAKEEELKRIIITALDQVVEKPLQDFLGSSSARSMFWNTEVSDYVREDDFKAHMGPFLPLQAYTIEAIEEDGRIIHCICLWDILKNKKLERYRVHFDVTERKGKILLNTVNKADSEYLGTIELTAKQKEKMLEAELNKKAAKAKNMLKGLGL